MLHYKAFLTVLVNIYITLLFTEVEVASGGLLFYWAAKQWLFNWLTDWLTEWLIE